MKIAWIPMTLWISVLVAAGCGGSTSDVGADLSWLDRSVCEGGDEELLPRAAQGDSLCADQPDCGRVGGMPNHIGCPNTCGCLCFEHRCYQYSCTGIGGCSEPPVFE